MFIENMLLTLLTLSERVFSSLFLRKRVLASIKFDLYCVDYIICT